MDRGAGDNRRACKQRFRWAFGTLQCLWKHADVTLRPRYGALGLVALPQAWLFQILLGAHLAVRRSAAHRAPRRRCLRLYAARRAIRSDEPQGHAFLLRASSSRSTLATAAVAFLFERRENWQLLWWLVLQRFGYRQLLYYVLAKSVSTAAKGHLVGWGKLDRKATMFPGNICTERRSGCRFAARGGATERPGQRRRWRP